MNRANRVRMWTLLALAAGALLTGYASEVVAQKAEAKKKAGIRLPNHYATVVTDEQRAKIYGIQEEFEPRLAKLRGELKALVGERDAAIEKVLTPAQRKEVEKLREAAAAARRSAATPATETGSSEKKPVSKSKKDA